MHEDIFRSKGSIYLSNLDVDDKKFVGKLNIDALRGRKTNVQY